ncbi:hypothetical protein J2D69_15815 [Lysinibacillus sphaericus]|uniref:Bacteriophage SP-beta YorD domain-containing protein n=3 Tax=Lysinibacillus TaxID=400634 RepID=B1HTM0_LYSSC|nr:MULTISPECIES: hypothetical protein [Lysinibacillus]MBE5082987.1 hypothetical protein [Bacillus thuringiensis]ACA41224.1 hypothetical protein Bsph_3740 [Lysinibacillus sphaericus C3-41]AMO32862.1 hypothetical protein AR327_10635 [Lysinibacillus sphaericus]AMR92034.1 hypothetical protein A1T07_18570 [Lysinibacillus sphaericus]ANA46082.1 hypothetical protein A2J09_11240 [Lysinibacillus sphaericus]
MLGHKLYYEKLTGNVVLTIPENPNANAVPTTKEQDFAMYSVLQARNPEIIDFIQLDFGQFQSDFQTARSWQMDVKTRQVLFEYPSFSTPLSTMVERLLQEKEELKVENNELKLALAESAEAQQQDKIENQVAIAELAELITTKEVL